MAVRAEPAEVKIDDAKMYDAMVTRAQAEFPGYTVAAKEKSAAMKVAAFEMWPFSPNFLNGFTTTWGRTTYMTTAEQATKPWGSINHEKHHVRQYVAAPVKYNLAYAMPQLLIVPALVVFWILVARFTSPLWCIGAAALHPLGFIGMVVAIAIANMSAWWLLALAGLAVLLLGPAPWRAAFEREAYLATMVMDALASPAGVNILGDTRYRAMHIAHYTGGGYLFMWPFGWIVGKWVDADLTYARELVNGTKTDPLYTPDIEFARAQAAA